MCRKKSFNLILCFTVISIIAYAETSSADGMPAVSKSNKTAAPSRHQNSAKKSPEKPVKKIPEYSLPDSELAKYQYCGKDSDCMQVINGCCQCMQGDPFTAINRDMLAEFMSRFTCSKVTCSEDTVNHSCNDGTVSCINFKCHYFPPR
jgi:hypothetical protein